jgi:hypothetical protein
MIIQCHLPIFASKKKNHKKSGEKKQKKEKGKGKEGRGLDWTA